MINIDEDRRGTLYRIGAWGSWWGVAGLLGINISMGGSTGGAPPWLGLVIVVLMGTGIAFGMALSRMRLASTISGVFQVGMRAAIALQSNLHSPAGVIEVDINGQIVEVEHAEVLGWQRDKLIGQPLDCLIPDRYLRRHQEGFKAFRQSGKSRVGGATLNVPVRQPNGEEKRFRLTVARMGAIFVGTLVPAAPMIEDVPEKNQPREPWLE